VVTETDLFTHAAKEGFGQSLKGVEIVNGQIVCGGLKDILEADVRVPSFGHLLRSRHKRQASS
jgi:hypothetical protein